MKRHVCIIFWSMSVEKEILVLYYHHEDIYFISWEESYFWIIDILFFLMSNKQMSWDRWKNVDSLVNRVVKNLCFTWWSLRIKLVSLQNLSDWLYHPCKSCNVVSEISRVQNISRVGRRSSKGGEKLFLYCRFLTAQMENYRQHHQFKIRKKFFSRYFGYT